MSRNTILLIVITVGLLLAGALLLPRLLDKEKILDLAAARLHEQTGMTLTVAGEVELDLLPGVGVSLEEVSLIMPGEQPSRLQLDKLLIGVRLWPLLAGRAEVDTLSLDGLHTRIQQARQADTVVADKLTDQQLDAFYEKRRRDRATAAGAEALLALPLALDVRQLRLTDASLELISADGSEQRVIELPSLEVSGLNLAARPLGVQARVLVPGERPLELILDGSLRIDQDRQWLGLDRLELTVSGAGTGELRLQASGEVNITRQIADLKLTVTSGDTRGNGDLRYARFESPQIDSRFEFNRLDPALLSLAGPGAASAATSNEKDKASGDEPLPLASIRRIDTRAELAVAQAVIGAHTIDGMELKLRALDGVIDIETLTGELHGGRLELQAVFDGAHNRATLDTRGSLTGLDIARALAAMNAAPRLTGTANLEWQLTSRGRTANELVVALQGPVKLTTGQVVLQELGVEHLLCQAVALTNKEVLTASFPDSTSFRTLSADIEVADGKARLRPLHAELTQIAVEGTGDFDLLRRDFDTRFAARLSPGLEQLDPACRLSKRLLDIEWPVDCKGSIAGDPADWCRADTEAVLEELATNEVLRKFKKKAGKWMDKLFD
jgi:AsmA protein